jgi:cell wall-associated NlpC family hydrolase
MRNLISAGLLFALLLAQPLLWGEAPQSRNFPQIDSDALLSLGMAVDRTKLDCSHFVHFLYGEAGLFYNYEPSSVLYRGTQDFKRVFRPKSGDLIVWPGHVGIVVDPSASTFLSALRRGVRIASYTSRYWRRRGHPRFFRYSLHNNNAPRSWRASAAGNYANSGME